MIWHLLRPTVQVGAALALTGLATIAAPTASAQTAWPASSASAAPAPDAPETVGPRRRPSRRSAARPARPDSSALHTVSSSASSFAHAAMMSAALRTEGRSWLGIPYRWGGESRRGIDCSAFTQQFVRETMGIELPRATAGQQYEGVGVSKSELRPGDLVFFRRGGTRHVGVYLGDDEFIHASTSRGVTVSSLGESYYTRYYWMARRIQTDPSGRRPTPRSGSRGDSAGVRG